MFFSTDMDEDKILEMYSYSAELATEILINYGYSFSIMPENLQMEFA